METQNPTQYLADLVMRLNSLETSRFGKLKCLYNIYKFKKNIKKLLKPPYTSDKLYRVLVFLNSASKLDLLRSLNRDYINFDIFLKSSNNIIMSGIINISIPCDDKTLKITYKPIVGMDNDIIELVWVVSDFNGSRRYSKSTNELSDRGIPDDRMPESKRLEYHSVNILYNAITNCINMISRNLYGRYIR